MNYLQSRTAFGVRRDGCSNTVRNPISRCNHVRPCIKVCPRGSHLHLCTRQHGRRHLQHGGRQLRHPPWVHLWAGCIPPAQAGGARQTSTHFEGLRTNNYCVSAVSLIFASILHACCFVHQLQPRTIPSRTPSQPPPPGLTILAKDLGGSLLHRVSLSTSVKKLSELFV